MGPSAYLEQIRAAANRFEATKNERQKKSASLKKGEWKSVDEPSRIARRMISRGMLNEVGLMISATETGEQLEFNPLERIIGEDERISATFLYQGAAVARSVGRVVIRSGSGFILGYGTGFMVSPRLLLTNNHVLNSSRTARASTIQFYYWQDPKGGSGEIDEFRLIPDAFFETNVELDFTLVAVEEKSLRGESLSKRGWSPLIEESGKSVVGEPVTIIQHPEGNPQVVVLPDRDKSKITNVVDHYLHYDADTMQGSSGSGVFNVDWELSALHHAGVPKRDSDSVILTTSGAPWDGRDDTAHLIDWVSNEGVRVSRIVDHLKNCAVSWSNPWKNLFEQSFEPRPLFDEVLDGMPHQQNSHDRKPRTSSETTRFQIDQESGCATWTIPIHVSVGLGEVPTLSPKISEPGGPNLILPPKSTDSPQYSEAISRLNEYADREYLEEEKNEEDCHEYYRELPWSLEDDPELLFQELHSLLKRTHHTMPRYRDAKLEYLYPWVDLVETTGGRELQSIYSGKGFDPREIIRLDLDVDRRREALAVEFVSTEQSFGIERIEAMERFLEEHAPYNCEHVVCQSWFNRTEPMRGDMHHLFTCESGCNSFRSNIPYWEFQPEEEKVRTDCGERVSNKFEPHANKGVAARATLYFLLRYPGYIGERDQELTRERLPILLDWHAKYPPERYEHHRNMAIFEVQGNRNPLIDFPDWAGTADFGLGLA